MQRIADYLELLRNGDRDAAFFGLVEAEPEIVPKLIERFRAETNQEVREFLVEVIWQHRDPSTVPFLASTLGDADPDVWKQSLDGLVTIGTVEAVNALLAARKRSFSCEAERDEFLAWIDEAIEQINSKY